MDQLAHKPGNPVYNLLPDLLSRLSAEAHLPPPAFQRVMRTLLGYIDKERQADSLVERLAGRFVGVDEPAKWRDVAFCMKELPCSEKAVKKLSEHFKQFAHTLVDDEVAAHFDKLCANACRRAKPEAPLRVAAEALAAKIAEVRLEAKPAEAKPAEATVEEAAAAAGDTAMQTEGPAASDVGEDKENVAHANTNAESEEEEEDAAPAKRSARGGTRAKAAPKSAAAKAAPKTKAAPKAAKVKAEEPAAAEEAPARRSTRASRVR